MNQTVKSPLLDNDNIPFAVSFESKSIIKRHKCYSLKAANIIKNVIAIDNATKAWNFKEKVIAV